MKKSFLLLSLFFYFSSLAGENSEPPDVFCSVELSNVANSIWNLYKKNTLSLEHNHLQKSVKSVVTPFTLISESDLCKNRALSENPAWGLGDTVLIEQYYQSHQETGLDCSLSALASFLGVIIHGRIDQEELGAALSHFDVQKLLENGPYPSEILSKEAQKLIYDSLKHFDFVLDIHLHNLGYDEGSYLNPKLAGLDNASWENYFTFLVLRYAAGMRSPMGSTHEARKRIHLYAGHFPKLKGFILPIHKAFAEGAICWLKTGSYLKDRSTRLTAMSFNSQHSDLFPAISIHPFDPNWKEKMARAAARGIRLIKWMPPQSIFPDSKLLDDYYKEMKTLGMTLIAHAGPEHAISL